MEVFLGEAAFAIMKWLFRVLGLVTVTYTGIELLVIETRDLIIGYLAVVPAEVSGFLGMLGIDQAINLIFSGILVRVALNTYSAVQR